MGMAGWTRALFLTGAMAAVASGAAGAGEGPRTALAKWIVEKSGVRKGMGLDLGPGDAELAMELARLTELRIHCVEPDAGKAAALRDRIEAAGLYGRVVVDEGGLQRLDYPDYCANLIVCGDEFAGGRGGRDFKELMRVLNPNGAALLGGRGAAGDQVTAWLREAGIAGGEAIRENGSWVKLRRPWDPGWDAWTHPSHDAGNTFGSNDTTVRSADMRIHWANEPVLGLSGATILLAGGRQFLECREFPNAPASAFPAIYAYDAFNGLPLWKREGKDRLPFDRSTRHYPPARPRLDVAATEDSLYVLGGALCHVLDAASGETKASWPVPPSAGPAAGDIWLYVSCVGDALYGASGTSPDQVKKLSKYNNLKGTSKAIFALDRRSGQVRWTAPAAAQVASIAVGEDKVFYCGADGKLAALDAASGKPAWENAAAGFAPGSMMKGSAYYRGKLWVLYHPMDYPKDFDLDFRNRQARVFSAKDGRFLFAPAFEWGGQEGPGARALTYLSLAGDMAYVSGAHNRTVNGGLDLNTGLRVPDKLRLADGVSKCTPAILTPNCLFVRGTHYVHDGPEAGKRVDSKFYAGFRPTCWYPALPGYGLVYMTAGGCRCNYAFRSNIAMMPGAKPLPLPDGKGDASGPGAAERLLKGPAWPGRAAAAEGAPRWATWRRDASRSGITEEGGEAPLRRLWSLDPETGAAPAAAAGDSLFLGSSTGKLRALDAATGRERWHYFARGRILTAPYVWEGRVYCGDEDGWVHCVNAADGRLVWAFRAALANDRVVAYGGAMSRWPVGCGVLVDEAEGIVYLLAGIFTTEPKAVYALDARIGAVKWSHAWLDSISCPRGVLALGKGRLFFTNEGGRPGEIRLDGPDHKPGCMDKLQVRTAVRQLAVVGDSDVIAGAPGFGFVMQYYFDDNGTTLPVVTEDTVYGRSSATLTGGGKAVHLPATKAELLPHALRAERRAKLPPLASQFLLDGFAETHRSRPPDYSGAIWEAWKGTLMTSVIKAGDIIYSGAPGKVYATAAADGKELWSAEVPGEPKDLAFCAGRLIVVCDSGAVICFGK